MIRTMKYAAQVAFLLTLTLVGVGCDSGGDDEDPNLDGRWLGTTTVQGATFTADLQINENGGNVNATGTVTFINPLAVSATGTYNFPNVSMTIQSSGFEDLNFSGTLSADGDQLTGSMNGSGFDNFSITLRRQ
jgi:hypothetical protein